MEEAYHAAPEGAVHIFPSIRSGEKNLRTWLQRTILAAGFTPWPRLWQNFRATRSTELKDKIPGRAPTEWLGHSEEIADTHYHQVTPEHFDRAISEPTGAMPGDLAQIPAHSSQVSASQDESRNAASPENPETDEAWE